jgi:hypothetical protein
VKLGGRYGQTIKDALPVLAQIQALQKYSTQQINSLCQVEPPAVKTTALRKVGKQRQIRFPIISQLRSLLPSPTFTNQGHGDKLNATTHRLGPGREKYGAFLVRCHPRSRRRTSKTLVIVYHRNVLQCLGCWSALTSQTLGDFLSTVLISKKGLISSTQEDFFIYCTTGSLKGQNSTLELGAISFSVNRIFGSLPVKCCRGVRQSEVAL